jgi:hypothetical protein
VQWDHFPGDSSLPKPCAVLWILERFLKGVAQICKFIQNLEETLKALQVAIKDKGVATQAETGVQNSIDSCIASVNELQDELIKIKEVKGSSAWSKVHG